MPHHCDSPPPSPRRRVRRWLPTTIIVAGACGLVLATTGVFDARSIPAATPMPSGAAPANDPVSRSIAAAQDRLRRLPNDSQTWAALGSAYVEQARITADPTYYTKAQGALDRSLSLRPNDGAAMTGMGALANARHDFAAARDWGLRATAAQPDSPAGYGVLADALTQLGDPAGATDAVQRMLDLRPDTTAFARASYDLELRGRTDDARLALEQALNAATGADQRAFCRYQLGELEFHSGRIDQAAQQYDQGLMADQSHVPLMQGQAKVAAARQQWEAAVKGYQAVVARMPLPQYLLEYAELLESLGRKDEARQQLTVLEQQQRLAESAGASDDLSAALVAADHGEPGPALRRAEAEWNRRQSVFSADALAWALHVNGRSAEALPYAERAAALGWRNATFAYHHAMIAKALNRRVEAERLLVAALDINPHFSLLHAPRARQALTELRSVR